jgi:hypothetical protein
MGRMHGDKDADAGTAPPGPGNQRAIDLDPATPAADAAGGSRLRAVLTDPQLWVPVAVLVLGLLVLAWIA